MILKIHEFRVLLKESAFIVAIVMSSLVISSALSLAQFKHGAANPDKALEIRERLAVGDFATPQDYGCSENDDTDCASATSSAAAVRNEVGEPVNVYLRSGTYLFKNSVTLTNGQMIFGDSPRSSIIHVNSTFNPSAKGVINFVGAQIWGRQSTQSYGNVARNFSIFFDQPQTQSSRSNFLTLDAGCTSGSGGSGCKYPPAILASAGANRFRVEEVSIYGAWDGIMVNSTGKSEQSNAGIWLNDLEIGSLNIGIAIDYAEDTCHIDRIHFWNFGLYDKLYSSVYTDGNNIAAQLGRCDGIIVSNFSDTGARFQLTSNWTGGLIQNLALDGTNATLEINTPSSVEISNVYATGSASRADTNCNIQINAGISNIANINIVNATLPAICVTGGTALVHGGFINPLVTSAGAISVTGGYALLSDLYIEPGAGTWTVPLVSQTGGNIDFRNNKFSNPAGIEAAFDSTVSSPLNIVTNNNWNGWAARFQSGAAGTYWPNTVNQAPILTGGSCVPTSYGPSYAAGTLIMPRGGCSNASQIDFSFNQTMPNAWQCSLVDITTPATTFAPVSRSRTGVNMKASGSVASTDSVSYQCWGQ